MNMPATLMWARGLEGRPIRIRFEPPQDLGWTPATQLFPTPEAWTFTAPNLQYLMDSPTELSAQTIRTFKVRNPDGKELTIRTAVHHDATDADIDEYRVGVEKIVNEEGAIYGEFPEFEPGTYTFLGDYVPWGGGDGMEHRNSTVVASRSRSKAPPAARSERSRTNSSTAGTSSGFVRKRSNPSTSRRRTSPASCGSPKGSRSTTASSSCSARASGLWIAPSSRLPAAPTR